MPGYGTGFGQNPTNNLWIGDNYSSGYSQANRNQFGPQMPMGSGYRPMQLMPQTMNNVLEVMGPESAEGFQVGPNSKVVLMDSNRPVFYVKRSDDSGYSETKAFEFHEIPLHPEAIQASQNMIDLVPKDEFDSLKESLDKKDYVTRKDFDEFKKMIEDLVMPNE